MDKKEILRTIIDDGKRAAIGEYFDSLGVYRTAVGSTVLSREIELCRLGEGKRTVLYIGAHHSLEAITENLLYALIYDMTKNAKELQKEGVNLEFLLQKFTFYIIPALNLDGISLVTGEGRENILKERQIRICGGNYAAWQANARGVDLNHNYSSGFLEYKKQERELGIFAAPSKYSGEYPESEPESRAVAELFRTLMPALVVSLHTQGEEIYYSPRTARVKRLAESFAAKVGYKIAIPEGSAKYGGLCDYTGACGTPSLTVEAGFGRNPLPISEAEKIYKKLGTALIKLPTML